MVLGRIGESEGILVVKTIGQRVKSSNSIYLGCTFFACKKQKNDFKNKIF